MSRGGIPVQPYFVLGGFEDEHSEDGESREVAYEKATAVVITFIVDNYDVKGR